MKVKPSLLTLSEKKHFYIIQYYLMLNFVEFFLGLFNCKFIYILTKIILILQKKSCIIPIYKNFINYIV